MWRLPLGSPRGLADGFGATLKTAELLGVWVGTPKNEARGTFKSAPAKVAVSIDAVSIVAVSIAAVSIAAVSVDGS